VDDEAFDSGGGRFDGVEVYVVGTDFSVSSEKGRLGEEGPFIETGRATGEAQSANRLENALVPQGAVDEEIDFSPVHNALASLTRGSVPLG
jgi:hypothetical protein